MLVPDPPALAALVRKDAAGQGGTVVPGKRPAEWLMDLVSEGALDRRLAVGLAAALLQHPEVVTLCEGARLSIRLQEAVLGNVLLRALAAHDMGLLLQSDPHTPESSVEDTLLAAAAATADLADPAVRRPLLERLRHAGLPGLELPILCSHGDEEDLAFWLPAVLAEGLGEAEERLLAARVARNDPGAAAILHVLRDWPDLARRVREAAARPT